MIVSALLRWFRTSARDLPWRRTHDPYAIWVSEVMLQQTQVATVLPYWTRWMRALPSIHALAKATPARIHTLWAGLGYYTRVRNMHRAAKEILEKHGGSFPTRFQDVLQFPGIGRYTAGAICSIAFNHPAPILDGNVTRVLSRLFGVAGNPREKETNTKLWALSEQLVQIASKLPGDWNCSHLNESLMELGAIVCTPRNPDCPPCPVRRQCVAFRQGRAADLPELPPRVAVSRRRFAAFVVDRGGRFLVRQRPAGIVNGHLWEFPNTELPVGDADTDEAAFKSIGFRPSRLELALTVKHTITRYRITMDVYHVRDPKPGKVLPGNYRWCAFRELKRLPFPSAHGKIVNWLQQRQHSVVTNGD